MISLFTHKFLKYCNELHWLLINTVAIEVLSPAKLLPKTFQSEDVDYVEAQAIISPESLRNYSSLASKFGFDNFKYWGLEKQWHQQRIWHWSDHIIIQAFLNTLRASWVKQDFVTVIRALAESVQLHCCVLIARKNRMFCCLAKDFSIKPNWFKESYFIASRIIVFTASIKC